MAISNLVLTQQIYSEEKNGAHAHYREPVPLNSLQKNTVPRNRVCSITTGLFFSEKYWRTLSIVWKYVFLLHVLNKNDNIISAGYCVLSEIAKIDPQQEKPVCPNRKS